MRGDGRIRASWPACDGNFEDIGQFLWDVRIGCDDLVGLRDELCAQKLPVLDGLSDPGQWAHHPEPG
jgi:hypothetical protein